MEPPSGWRARLDLRFARRGEATVLEHRRHEGPLLLQKALYPEGEAVCHGILVHPPGGVAEGDDLALAVEAGAGSGVLLTTAGAGRWYRSRGSAANQRCRFQVAEGATLEWLPQETIVYDGTQACLDSEFCLEGGARLIAWDVVCLGRIAAGERFRSGALSIRTAVRRDGRLLWYEHGRLGGGSLQLTAPTGHAGQPVYGTLLAAAATLDDALLAACQAQPADGQYGITRLPGLLIARCLCAGTEAARAWFFALWRLLRPAVAGRPAVEPRIWRT